MILFYRAEIHLFAFKLGYGKSLIYQVAPAKTGLISRGEHHSLSWQLLHMRDRKHVRSRQRSLLLRFPAQIETSVSREIMPDHIYIYIPGGAKKSIRV